MIKKRGRNGQVGVEYMIIIGFVTFAVVTIFAFATVYSDKIQDRIRLNQIEGFANEVIVSSESVFFAGEPSKTVVNLYLPKGVKQIDVNSDGLVFTVSTTSGDNVRGFESDVPLQGSISTTEGLKKIRLEARDTYLLIS